MGLITTTKPTEFFPTTSLYGITIYIYYYLVVCDCTRVKDPTNPANADTIIIECLNFASQNLQCYGLNVKFAECVQHEEINGPAISIPIHPENDEKGEIRCTSPMPLVSLGMDGYQLADFINVTYERTLQTYNDENTYQYTVGFTLSEVKGVREIEILLPFPGSFFAAVYFFLFRPGDGLFSYFQDNTTHDIPVKKYYHGGFGEVKIPCIPTDPNNTNMILTEVPPGIRIKSYDFINGFTLSVQPFDDPPIDPTGSYVCTASKNETEEVATLSFQVISEPVANVEALPETNQIYLFRNSEQKIFCKSYEKSPNTKIVYNRPVTIEGHVNGEARIIEFDFDKFSRTFTFETEFTVKAGDGGRLECKNSSHSFKNWTIETLDISSNPILQLTKLSENVVECKSSENLPITDIKLLSFFCQGEDECRLNQFCLDEKEDITIKHNKSLCKTKLGTRCENSNNSICLTLPQDEHSGLSSQGILKCSVGSHSYRTNFLIGFDNVLYLDWQDANDAALISIHTPNKTMEQFYSYPFVCKASKFISDGKLQWKIGTKSGNEIFLEEDQVQDVHGRYATEHDYQSYTVRESIITLNYSSGFDVICLVPVWNTKGWRRLSKRIDFPAMDENTQRSSTLIIILGCTTLVIILLVGAVLFVSWRWKKAKNTIRNLTAEEVDEFLHGNQEARNEYTLHLHAHELVDTLSYDHKFEIPREKLLIDIKKVLGKGQFGIVYKGNVQGSQEDVAIKTPNENCDVESFKGFLRELKIMIYIGKHSNIVSLVGASTEKIQEKTLYIVSELCENGSLESYLRKCRNNFIPHYVNKIEETGCSSDRVNGTICGGDLLKWSYQVANGMDHLQSKKVIHADLAARNVLLDSRGNAKITDFGLSRRMYAYAQYVKQTKEQLPWRSMAIESLRHLKFSSQSDVWAFGILLWEIYSIGEVPYPGINWGVHFVQQLADGLRLIKPPHCTDEIYQLMLKCWGDEPNRRPTFGMICEFFKHLLDELKDVTERENPDEDLTSKYVPMEYLTITDP